MTNLFGTDGIRGRVVLDACDDEEALERIVEERELTPQLMKLLGEALGRVYPNMEKEAKSLLDGTIAPTMKRLQHGSHWASMLRIVR